MSIDPKLVIEFSVIAEESSFTKAAERLRVAQPWLSTRLRRLESIIGFALFTRNTRTVTLTERGERLLTAARTLASAAETVDAQIKQLRSVEGYRLRIGAPPYTKGISERRRMIDRFVSSFPSVNFELQTGWSIGLKEKLKEYELDLALVLGDYDPTIFDGMLLRNCGLALTVSKDHVLAGQSRIDPAQVSGCSVQVFTRSLNPELWDRFYAPLIDGGVRLIERPEVAEAGPDHMTVEDPPVAFIDLREDGNYPGSTVQVPVRGNANAPLYMLRRRNDSTSVVSSFWSIAASLEQRGDRAKT